jgi:hypothetical protein
MQGLFEAPPTRSVARSLLVACLWSLALVVAGALAVGVVALIAAGVGWVVRLTGGDVAGTVTEHAAVVASWTVGVVSVIALIWVAAYASTGWGSWRRAALGVVAGLALGVGYTLLGASLGIVVALATGWAMAIPSEKAGRVAVRAVPGLLVGVASLPSTTARLLALLLSPWAAAALVLVGDLAWTVSRRSEDE